jgi:hypothetical protein
MAKISELPDLVAPTGLEHVPVVDEQGVTRRALVGALAGAAALATIDEAAEAAVQRFDDYNRGPAGPANNTHATVASLRKADPNNLSAFLTQRGREGSFTWESGDHSAEVAADPLGAVWITRESDPTGKTGAWRRADRRPSAFAYGSLQDAAMAVERQGLRSLYIPAATEASIPVTSTITLKTPGVRISGDLGGSYNRGAGKGGWLEAAAGIGCVFDLGASRTYSGPSDNGADNWQVDGISIRQAAGVPVRSVDGIRFSSRTDGPDRGAILRSVSIRGMKDAITVENPDLSTNLASLSLDGCVIIGNESILNAKGRLLGLSMTNCQLEQNAGKAGTDEGVIKGSVDGPVFICTNMLEGQNNFLDIRVPATFGNSPKVIVAFNYYEANGGDYVHRFACSTSRGHLTIGPNYTHNITAKDYVVLTGAGTSFVDVYDDFPVTFDNSAITLKYGSNILRNRQTGYKVRRLGSTAGAKSPEVIIADYHNLRENSGNPHVHAVATAGTVMSTPIGERTCATLGSQLIGIQVPVAIGDLIEVNIFMRAEQVVEGNFLVNLYADDGVTPVFQWTQSAIPLELAGRWALVSITGLAQAASTRLRLGMRGLSGTFDFAIAGASARNHGAHVNDGSAFKLVRPVMPRMIAAEQSGWTAGTGTPLKGAFAAFAGFAAGEAYMPQQLQKVADASSESSRRLLAIEQALRAAGIVLD